MRISDWSSDVCSSDLIAAGLVAERPRSRSALVEGIEQRRAALIVGPSGAGKSALMWEAANALRHTEIGRASCRERVCQYVSISVVAVSLKKKIRNVE